MIKKSWLSPLLFLVLGCGGSGGGGAETTGVIEGKILFQEKALPGGIVTFHIEGEGGAKSTSPTSINEDGSYKIQLVNPGKAKIAVDTAIVKGTPRYIPIPAKYANPATSGLTMVIGKGRQSKDIELK